MPNNLKISTRLVAAFAVLVALLLAIGGLSVVRTMEVRTQLVDITDRRMDAIATLEMLRDEANFQARAIRNVAIQEDPSFVANEIKAINESRERVGTFYTKADELIESAEGKASLQAMLELRRPFGEALDKFKSLISSGQRPARRSGDRTL